MAQIGHYDIGDIWQPTWTFKVGTTPTDPTTISYAKKNPAGTITTATENTPATPSAPLTRVSAGVFRYDIPIDAAGYWYAKMTGTGAVVAAETQEAIADPDLFTLDGGLSTRALVGLGETKDWLETQQIDTGEDMELIRLINDVSDRFHEEAAREFKVKGTNPQARTFEMDIRSSSPWYVDGVYMGDLNPSARSVWVGDLTSFTAVDIFDYDWTTVLTPTVPLTQISAYPLVRGPAEPIRELVFNSAAVNFAPGRRVRVTGTWGFPSVPGDVRQAVLDAIAAIRDRDVEHYRQDLGVGGSQDESRGTTIMLSGGGQRLLSLPPTAAAVAWRYRDSWLG